MLFVKVREAFALVDLTGRAWIVGYVVASFVGSLLEAGGLALVFAFFQVALSPQDIHTMPFVSGIYIRAGEPAPHQFLAALSVAVVLTFAVRSVVLMAILWLGLAFRRRLQCRLADRLFAGYLSQPVAWHLLRGTARAVNNVGQNVGQVVQHLVLASLDIFAAVVTLFALLATMAWIRPLETLVALLLLGGLGFAFIASLRPYLVRWGFAQILATERLWALINEAIRGIKTVRIFGLESFFADNVSGSCRTNMDLMLKQSLARQTPKYILETLLVGGVLATVAVALGTGARPAEIIPTMALFAGAAVRMLPQAMVILGHVQYMRLSEAALYAVREDMPILMAKTGGHYDDRNVRFDELELRNVSFSYAQDAPSAISNISLTVHRGEHIALVGLSGSGKTTLADLLMGLLTPQSGDVLLNGKPSTALPPQLFTYVPQESFVTQDTLRRNIAVGKDDIDEPRLQRAIADAALAPVIARLPGGLDTTFAESGAGLSVGERQRMGIARALYRSAPILVMDEPTSALDAFTEAEVAKAISRLKGRRAVVVIAHRLSTIRDFDKIVYLEEGRITGAGTFSQLYAAHPRFKAMVDFLSLGQPDAA